jgi:cytochrome c-type biogenesis protein
MDALLLVVAGAVPVFGAGLASAASPCLLPLYPGFLAYLTANTGRIAGRRASGLLGLVVLLGLLTTMIAIGLVLTTLGIAFGQVLLYVIPAMYVLLAIVGVLLILGRNPFERLPGMRVPIVANPYLQAYVYGIMLGPIALPCAGPFLGALLGISLGIEDTVGRLGTFVIFGLGFGLPLVLLSFVAAARGQAVVRWIVARHRPIELVAGVLVTGFAVYELVDQWPNLAFALGL